MIQKFYNMWWKEKNKDGECIDFIKKQINVFIIKNVGGIFVVLIVGIMVGVVVVFFEFLWKVCKNVKEDKVGIFNILSIFFLLIKFFMLYFFEFRLKIRKGYILNLNLKVEKDIF